MHNCCNHINHFLSSIYEVIRIAEITSRAFDYALFERGPTQINIPRDLFYTEYEFIIPRPRNIEYPIGGMESIQNAINLLSQCTNPCILAGGGVRMSGINAINNVAELSNYLGAAVATTYLHNDSFPCSNDLSVGPLGYQGFESAMKCINESDVILAIGSRMNPFGTLQQYGFDYWPKKDKCKIIQIDIDHKILGLTKDANVYINGDANSCIKLILNGLKSMDKNKIDCLNNKQQRLQQEKQLKDTIIIQQESSKINIKPKHAGLFESLLTPKTANNSTPHVLQPSTTNSSTQYQKLESITPNKKHIKIKKKQKTKTHKKTLQKQPQSQPPISVLIETPQEYIPQEYIPQEFIEPPNEYIEPQSYIEPIQESIPPTHEYIPQEYISPQEVAVAVEQW